MDFSAPGSVMAGTLGTPQSSISLRLGAVHKLCQRPKGGGGGGGDFFFLLIHFEKKKCTLFIFGLSL